MGGQVVRAAGSILGGIRRGVGERLRVFAVVAVAVFLANVALPPVVLAVTRKPWDHASVNPWLRKLPAWLASDEATWQRKAQFVWNAALYWVIASGTHDAAEWGYTATVRDVARWMILSLLFGTYFALWWAYRERLRACGVPSPAAGGRRAGTAGVLLSIVGFSTLPCSVVGCGAPVLPVVGLALSGLGLTSQTLALINGTARGIMVVVYGGVLVGITALAWRLAAQTPAGRADGRGATSLPV